jgi:hypothetical protein
MGSSRRALAESVVRALIPLWLTNCGPTPARDASSRGPDDAMCHPPYMEIIKYCYDHGTSNPTEDCRQRAIELANDPDLKAEAPGDLSVLFAQVCQIGCQAAHEEPDWNKVFARIGCATK